MLSVLNLLIQEGHPFDMPFYLAAVEDGADLVGCVVRAPPDPLILSRVPAEAMPLVVSDVRHVYETVPTVTGMEDDVEAFAECWRQQNGSAGTARTGWRWYALDRAITPEKMVSGKLRLAQPSDRDLVRHWAAEFTDEIGTPVDVGAFFERRMETSSLYLWEDGAPRTIVAVSGVTPNTIRLSGVFTDPEFRRKGYATATVAAISRLMLDSGHRICLLFTEITDPSANRLYRRIGYEPIFDKISIDLCN